MVLRDDCKCVRIAASAAGTSRATSALAAIFNGFTPVVTTVLAHFTIAEERMTGRTLVGMLLVVVASATLALLPVPLLALGGLRPLDPEGEGLSRQQDLRELEHLELAHPGRPSQQWRSAVRASSATRSKLTTEWLHFENFWIAPTWSNA